MRSILAAATLTVLLFAVGCNVIGPHRPEGQNGSPITRDGKTPTINDLVNYLNNNAKLIEPTQAISCGNVTIDVNAQGQKVGLGGQMMCQAPRNFLLRGEVFSKPEVEIGSNEKEFWYWIARNQPPYLFHCSYDALARGTRVPFPFQPDMAVCALGLAQYDPAGHYEMKIVEPRKGFKAYELIEQTMSPQNKPIQKVTVFDSYQAMPPQPQVIAHVLRDPQTNKVICTASVRRVQQLGTNGPIIPKELVFEWPEQKMQLTMRLENPQLRSMPTEKAATVFTRQNLNYQSFDLATQTLDGPGVQRAGAQMIRR